MLFPQMFYLKVINYQGEFDCLIFVCPYSRGFDLGALSISLKVFLLGRNVLFVIAVGVHTLP